MGSTSLASLGRLDGDRPRLRPSTKEVLLALGQKGGGSLEYKWKSPTTHQVGTKISFVKPTGQQTCGVGAYE